jgi:alkaline phosphatase D
MLRTSRRSFLAGSLIAAGAAVLPDWRTLRAADLRFKANPFSLGVASGYPAPTSVVLWTRIAPSPLEPGGGVPAGVVPVKWELATDEKMAKVVRRGEEYATPEWAHSVHVEPDGLEPGRDYWYRFTVGDARSIVGRTRTAPPYGAATARLRMAVASCQQYEQGYFTAYRHMLADNLDLLVHVGDYIYEGSFGEKLVRSHGAPETYTLEDYRLRYSLYKSDPDLAAAHAACPWLVTWDDHEVDNDYADETSEENDDPQLFLARRAAAYRAYYEHMPLPRRAAPFGANMRLYTQRAFGDLASVFLLDQRQYRSPQACHSPGRRGGSRVSNCSELDDPSRTMLGAPQEEWLHASLGKSGARWNLLAQGTVMAYLDEDPGGGRTFWSDAWNGYPAARKRLYDVLAERRVANPVVLSGDIHAFVVSRLNREPADLDSPLVGSELVTTSITTQGVPQKTVDGWRNANPDILLLDSQHRGYLRLDVTQKRLQADLVALDSEKNPRSTARVLQSFVIEDGKPGPVPL